ncbi:MAG: hypothetical protein HC905_25775 [Bacteroidales bacterium]|nr:hypothetical protein [Bacteroidales bacterium]
MTFSTQLREKGTVVFIFLLILISQFNVSFSQELLIRNETFTITKESDPIYDGNAFHTWEDMSELPDNWVSPVNYYDGKIYVRYQILEQPKVDMDGDGTKEYTRKTKIQFAFWQTQPDGKETAGDHVNMNGPGSVGEASSVLSTMVG